MSPVFQQALEHDPATVDPLVAGEIDPPEAAVGDASLHLVLTADEGSGRAWAKNENGWRHLEQKPSVRNRARRRVHGRRAGCIRDCRRTACSSQCWGWSAPRRPRRGSAAVGPRPAARRGRRCRSWRDAASPTPGSGSAARSFPACAAPGSARTPVSRRDRAGQCGGHRDGCSSPRRSRRADHTPGGCTSLRVDPSVRGRVGHQLLIAEHQLARGVEIGRRSEEGGFGAIVRLGDRGVFVETERVRLRGVRVESAAQLLAVLGAGRWRRGPSRPRCRSARRATREMSAARRAPSGSDRRSRGGGSARARPRDRSRGSGSPSRRRAPRGHGHRAGPARRRRRSGRRGFEQPPRVAELLVEPRGELVGRGQRLVEVGDQMLERATTSGSSTDRGSTARASVSAPTR